MSNDVVTLPERASVDSAKQLISAAKDFDGDGAFMVDASSVTTMDGSTALALIAVVQSFSVKGVAVTVSKPSAAFVDAFTDLGLYEDFAKMELQQ